MPAFVIFTDATLLAIAEQEPRDERALLKVSGVGRTKVDRYGEALLAIVDGRTPEGLEEALFEQ